MRFPALTGGPLSDDYELWQYHAHWGKEDSLGSEHKVNGQSYAGEVLPFTIFARTLPTFEIYFTTLIFFKASLGTLESIEISFAKCCGWSW